MTTLMKHDGMGGRIDRRRALAMLAGAAAVGVAGRVNTASATVDEGDGGMIDAATAGIIVSGNGVAKAPAMSAILQFICRLQDPYAGDPAAAERAASGGGYGYGNVPGPTEAELQVIADAVIAVGVDAENVVVVAMPAGSAGMFGYGVGLVLVNVDDPAMFPELPAMVEAGTEAAWDAGMTMDQVGASYTAADCDALGQEALTEAVANAKTQAEQLAVALGVELGNLIGATTYGMYSPSAGYVSGETGCAAVPDFAEAQTTWLPGYTGTTEPMFETSVQVQLTFDFSEA
jgi:hypothetical protein